MTAGTSSVNVQRLRYFKVTWLAFYASVLLFTIICLGMAGSLKSKLADSDLTRFLPFALFVCTVSMVIILTLAFCSLRFTRSNPISTRIELMCLSIAAIIWFALGIYLATSPSQNADVECFASDTSSEPLDDSVASFHTEQYQAMYRVLNAFALLNAIIVLVAVVSLGFLALRSYRRGDEHMLYSPVMYCAWFVDSKPRRKSSQVAPRRSSSSRTHLNPPTRQVSGGGMASVPERSRSSSQRKPTYPEPVRQTSGRKHSRRQNSGHSILPSSSSINEDIANGVMRNPNRATPGFR